MNDYANPEQSSQNGAQTSSQTAQYGSNAQYEQTAQYGSNVQYEQTAQYAPPTPPPSNYAPPQQTQYTQPQYAQPQPNYGQTPPTTPYVQPAYSQPEDTGGFGLSLAGLILGVLGICLVGIILSGIGLSKSRKTKAYDSNNSKANASYVMGIIGVIWSALGLITQIIVTILVIMGLIFS